MRIPLFRKRINTDQTWEAVIKGLQALRGKNMLRARETQLRPLNLIRLEYEKEPARMSGQYVEIRITEQLEDLHAKSSNKSFSLSLQDKGTLDTFLKEVAEELRKGRYIRTQAKKADYR